jgi:hypothetical protein
MAANVRVRARQLASAAGQEAMTRLVKSARIPRIAFQHYFIEDDGLHSRIHLQNYYSTFWPHIRETVQGRIDAFDAGGRQLGTHEFSLPPFGSLFLEARDLLDRIGAPPVREGSVTIDLEPPQRALQDLAEFPIPEPWSLRLSTPFWMAYYDRDENYMYVHSIDRHAGRFFGVPAPIALLLKARFGGEGTSWRAGRLLDVEGLRDFQVVTINHSASARNATVGAFDSSTDAALWTQELEFAPHALHRVRIDPDRLRDCGATQFRVGVDPLPTLNGKPYVLMRYGDGPLSLHHG